jgi:TPR repeat protein
MRYAAIAVVLAIFLSGSSAAAGAQVIDPRVAESGVLETKCDAGDQNACVDFGQRLWYGEFGVKRDTVRAISVLERACDAGKLDGCFKLGEKFQYGGDAAKVRALPLFQKACDGAHGDACASLGVLYTPVRGIDRDDTRAASLFERACNLGSASGCQEGARLHHPGGVALKNATLWAGYMMKLCDSHHQSRSCFALGLVYDLGMWVPKDSDRANELFKKSCFFGTIDGNKEACGLIRR